MENIIKEKEIEAKRNLRQGGSQGGPLKLGAKKMGQWILNRWPSVLLRE